ncbi:MAG: radical SAM protein, partial [Methylophilaceae bacterium]
FANVPKLAVQFHLPVQAGSDRILMSMKRNHTVLQYKSIIRKLKAASPNITFTSDFIIGFPGETEKDFEATVKLMEDVGFDYSFSFLYSPRPGTPAAFIEDGTPHQTKLDRLSRLQAINTAQGEVISRSMLGTSQRVLIEGVSRKNPDEMVGKTDNNRIVTIAKNEALTGHFVNVKITSTDNPRRLQSELI